MARIARPEEAARMRTKLISAAYEEMVEKGCQAVTLADIARRAGVSKGLPLYYFASKDALLAAVMQRTTELIKRRVDRVLRRRKDPLEQLQVYLEAMTLDGRSHRDFYRVYLEFMTMGLHHMGIATTARDFILDRRVVEVELIANGIAVGRFRRDLDPAAAAAAVRALFDGLSLQWLFHPEEPFADFRRRLHTAVLTYLIA